MYSVNDRSHQMAKEAVKKAALELFRRYSYVKTTVADIAAATGIGKGSVYLAFKSKDEILFSIIDDISEAMRKQHDPWFFDPSVNLDTKIERISTIILDQLFQIRDLMFGSFENVEGRELQDIYNKFSNSFDQLTDYLLQVVGLHGWPSSSARLAAIREFVFSLLGRFVIHILGNDWNDREAIYKVMPGWAIPIFHSIVLRDS